MAIEDAAALGILFNKEHFSGDVAETLRYYQEIRLPRATKVQAASAKAAYNINERIGKYLIDLYKAECSNECRLLEQHSEHEVLQGGGRKEEIDDRGDEWVS